MKAREEAPMQPMSRPEEALNNLMESVLLAFRFDPRRRTFTLVSDYPFRSPGSRREFAGFVLEDVDFERLAGDNEYDQAYQDSFQAQGPGGLVFQSIRQQAVGSGRRRIELWFGPSFGGVAVVYGSVRGYARGSTAEQVGPMEWVYRDSRTREEFDFYRPFPALIAGDFADS